MLAVSVRERSTESLFSTVGDVYFWTATTNNRVLADGQGHSTRDQQQQTTRIVHQQQKFGSTTAFLPSVKSNTQNSKQATTHPWGFTLCSVPSSVDKDCRIVRSN